LLRDTPKSKLPSRNEGRFAIVTNVGLRDAVDAMAHKTNAPFADGEIVWSWHLDADAKLASDVLHRADDGDKKARFTGESAP